MEWPLERGESQPQDAGFCCCSEDFQSPGRHRGFYWRGWSRGVRRVSMQLWLSCILCVDQASLSLKYWDRSEVCTTTPATVFIGVDFCFHITEIQGNFSKMSRNWQTPVRTESDSDAGAQGSAWASRVCVLECPMPGGGCLTWLPAPRCAAARLPQPPPHTALPHTGPCAEFTVALAGREPKHGLHAHLR